MRRADRLFQIIQILRTHRIVTAQRLSQMLEVSERTIYRDIRDLMLCGVPIEGEAGVGYILRRGFDLPPLMFDEDEITALALGARIVKSWADPQLANAADRALSKIEVVLPDKLKGRLAKTSLFAPMSQIPKKAAATMAVIRPAIEHRIKINFNYKREDGVKSTRIVWPLGLFFWGSVWTLGAWCELRTAFRNFRLDRISSVVLTQGSFPQMPGRTLEDLIKDARQKMEKG